MNDTVISDDEVVNVNISEYVNRGRPVPRTHVEWSDRSDGRGELCELMENVYTGGIIAPYRRTGQFVTTDQVPAAEEVRL